MTRYTPGAWLAAVAAGGAVVVPATSPTAERLWRELDRGASLADVLQLLVAGHVSRLSELPPFAVAVLDAGGAAVAVRGPLRVAAGGRAVEGSGVATWREDSFPGAAEVALSALDDVDGPSHPLVSGVVAASRVVLSPSGADNPAPDGGEPGGGDPSPAAGPADPGADLADPDGDLAGPGGGVAGEDPSPAVESAKDEARPKPEAAVSPVSPSPASAGPRAGQAPPGRSPSTPVEHSGHTTVLPMTEAGWALPPPDAEAAPQFTTSYDHLFDDPTSLGTAEKAAVRGTAEPAASESDEDDHDGMTVASFQAVGPASAASPRPVAPVAGPTVLARVCATCGRPNSTLRATCSQCEATLAGDAAVIARPVLGELLVSNGERVPLDRPVIVGRRPKAPRFTNDDMPRLVAVAGPQQDISRSHLKVDLEDWSVLVTDLGSTNGTVLRRAGQPDRRLQGPEQVVAQAGDVFDLGDGVTVTVVELA
jgi:hypothetical protein